MKRYLYLVRHADSRWSDAIGNDFQRVLTEEGEQNAREMGRRLHDRGIQPDLILTSPAVRARSTAEIIAEAMGLEAGVIQHNPQIYEATSRLLLDIINDVADDTTHMLLVGHNPAVSRIVAYLTQHSLENIPPTGAVGMSFELERWAFVAMATGTFEWFDSPQNAMPS